jgi:hypothetical protein
MDIEAAQIQLFAKGFRTLWFVVLVAVFFSSVARIPQLRIPYDRDEGAYAYMSDVIDRGGLPYRDAFDHKPPGIYYIYNLSFKIFGHDIQAPRIAALLSVAIASVLVFLFVYKISFSFSAGILSMGLLAWGSSSAAYAGFSANTEIFVLPCLAGASLCLIRNGGSKRKYFLCGLLFGIALIIKQTVLPIALSSLIFVAINQRHHRNKVVSVVISFMAGLVFPFAYCTLWFSFKGAFYSYWAGLYVYNQSYSSLNNIWNALGNFLGSLQFILYLDAGSWIAGCLGLMALGLSQAGAYHKWLILAPLAGSLISVSLGGFYFPHYFLMVIPYSAMAAGVGGSAFGVRGANHIGKWLLAMLLIVGVINNLRFSAKSSDEKFRIVYGSDLFSRSLTVGRFLRSQSNKNEKVFVSGSEAQILFYSSLSGSSRFYYYYPLTMPSSLRDEFRTELISSIAGNPADYLIRVNNPSSLFNTSFAPDKFDDYMESIYSSYRPIGISLEGSSKISTGNIDPATERIFGSIVIYKNMDNNKFRGMIRNQKDGSDDLR